MDDVGNQEYEWNMRLVGLNHKSPGRLVRKTCNSLHIISRSSSKLAGYCMIYAVKSDKSDMDRQIDCELQNGMNTFGDENESQAF